MGLFKKKEYRQITPTEIPQQIQMSEIPDIEPKQQKGIPKFSSTNDDKEILLELAKEFEKVRDWAEKMVIFISKRV